MKHRRMELWPGVGEQFRRQTVRFMAVGAIVWGVLVAQAQSFHPLDLARFCTVPASNSTTEAFPFPSGPQRFAGIPFAIAGKIELMGMDAARRGAFFPTEVTGIPANQKARQVHLLIGALHGQRDGTPLAKVVLHFKNGDTRALRLAFGIHTRNYLEEDNASKHALIDPNSHVVWHGTNAPGTRLFSTVFDNPKPEEEIAAIDLVSLFSRATPIVFALTLQEEAATPLLPLPKSKAVQRATEFQDAVYRRALEVRVTDSAGGKTIPNVITTLTMADDAKAFFFGQYKADASGRVVIPYPPQHAASMTVRARSPGYVAGSATLSALDGKKWPDILELRLEHGSTIGGVVVDGKDQPIADAAVIPFEIKQTAPNQFTRNDFDVAMTGPDGKWSAHASLESLSNILFEIRHPEYHPATLTWAEAISSRSDENSLLNMKAVLQPHIVIAGRVINGEGTPVSRATVILDRHDDTRETRITDSTGKFSFVIREPSDTNATLVALATNYAPLALSVPLDSPSRALTLTLDAGSTFRMRVTDGQGGPLPGVAVKIYRWQGTQLLPWSTHTDDEGRFKWEHAPTGLVTFRFDKTGYLISYYSATLPTTAESTYVYTRPIKVAGKVIDARTKKAVDNFRARLTYRYTNGSGSSTTIGRKGAFTVSLSGAGRSFTELTLLIESTGYAPLNMSLPPDGVLATNVFELKKAKMIEGVVLGPDGFAVTGTELLLLDRSTSAYMDQPGRFRASTAATKMDRAVADANGHFELTPKIEADLVLASHPTLGYAQMAVGDLESTGKMKLQPWGHIHGVLRVGDKVEPSQYVAVHTQYISPSGSARSSAPLYLYYKMQPEADGHFAFDAVPPGERTVYLRYIRPQNTSGAMLLSHNVPVTVKGGETNEVLIGGTGRTVVGKIHITGLEGVQIDGSRGTFYLQSQNLAGADLPPPLIYPPNATPAERQKLLRQRQDDLALRSQERMRLNRLSQHSYLPLFGDDNSFQIPNVPPGTYSLHISPYDPRQRINDRMLGSITRQVTVPAGETPHDLGVFDLPARP